MTDTLADRCEILRNAWRWWTTTLAGLDESGWAAATRLEGWDVAALAAHHSMFVQILGVLVAQSHEATTTPEVESARDMLRRFNEPGGVATTAAGTIAELARQDAQNLTHADVVRRFAESGPEALARVEQIGPVVVDYLGNRTFPIVEALSIGILEAVVHGLDLCAATGIAGESIPEPAMAHTVALLASMADPVAFVDAATGRSTAAVLPVLS